MIHSTVTRVRPVDHVAEVAPTPGIAVTPANSTVQFGGNYTLVMADAGPVGTDESAGQTRHWLVNSVTVANGS